MNLCPLIGLDSYICHICGLMLQCFTHFCWSVFLGVTFWSQRSR